MGEIELAKRQGLPNARVLDTAVAYRSYMTDRGNRGVYTHPQSMLRLLQAVDNHAFELLLKEPTCNRSKGLVVVRRMGDVRWGAILEANSMHAGGYIRATIPWVGCDDAKVEVISIHKAPGTEGRGHKWMENEVLK